MIRSYLFVPGDDQHKIEKACSGAADALIFDLEDSVAVARLDVARTAVAETLRSANAHAELWVRINALDSGRAADDLDAIVAAKPAGIVLPKPRSAHDVERLDRTLSNLEAEHGLVPGQIAVMPIVTECPEAIFSLHEYAGISARLCAMSWGAEDLAAAVGASRNRDDNQQFLPPYQLARSLSLFAAAAARVAAVETVYTDFRDIAGLTSAVMAARRDGFRGMLAIHPGQVAIINEGFAPTAAELERSQKIVAAFAENRDAGVVGIDGEMIDRPHLRQAEKMLELARKLIN